MFSPKSIKAALRQMREEAGITTPQMWDLAADKGIVNRSTLHRWHNGGVVPSLEKLRALEVAMREVSGKQDGPLYFSTDNVKESLRRLREEAGITTAQMWELAIGNGTSRSTLYRWRTGKARPTVDKLREIAENIKEVIGAKNEGMLFPIIPQLNCQYLGDDDDSKLFPGEEAGV